MKFISEQEYRKNRPRDKWVSACPFCIEYLDQDYLVRSNIDWNIMHPTKPCWWPTRWKWHLLLLPKFHHENETTLRSDERLSRVEAEKRIKAYFWNLGIDYISFVRLTDQIKSIQHLHYHYIWGDILYRDIANSTDHYDKESGMTRDEE